MILQASSLAVLLSLATRVLCESTAESLYGTWTSKSYQVFTGPGFFDPVEELLIEPSLPGLSYSFTEDGYFEEAAYRVQGNPKEPGCPVAVLLYQHGKFEVQDNGSLVLHPFEVDGRQLLSEPCEDRGTSTYSRYNQTEVYKSFVVQDNEYHGVKELQLFASDGSVMVPLYLAYQPPVMLPTFTLNPTKTASETSETGSKNKRSLRSLVKRGLENKHKTNAVKRNKDPANAALYWWLSAGLVGVGSVAFLAA